MDLDNVNDEMTLLKDRLLDHISESTEAHFKSQQVGDPDLTKNEKRNIAENVLSKSYALFLSRFGKHLLEGHLKFFKALRGLKEEEYYEVSFYLREIESALHKSKRTTVVKNRRLEALKRLALQGEYFSEEEMKRRNPLLYEHLVGRYLTEDEKAERAYSFDYTAESLSHFLLERYDIDQAKKLLEYQRDQEDSVMEEEEESSEEELDESNKNKERQKKNAETNEYSMWGERKVDIPPADVSETEKKIFFEEFRSHMYSNFLQGKDSNFDYSIVDSNADYDDMDTMDRDAEEKYFDSESPEETLRIIYKDMQKKTDNEEDDSLETFMCDLKQNIAHQEMDEK